MKSTPERIGLYDAKYERDSCGVGLTADIEGRASRKIVSDANKLLVRMTHRGGKQSEDGDGAGIMVAIPHRFFKKLSIEGQVPFASLPPLGRYGVAMMFLPNGSENEHRRFQLMDAIENIVRSFGLEVLGWRSPLPTKSTILGPNGRATEPFIAQLFVTRPCDACQALQGQVSSDSRLDRFMSYEDLLSTEVLPSLDSNNFDPGSSFAAFDFSMDQEDLNFPPTEFPSDLERLLYLIRRKLCNWTDMYVCSFSSRVVVYKGQLQSEKLFTYFDDLMDEDFTSYMAIIHARFSTNTFPTWDRAHPYRRLAHNGEINTIDSNRRWLAAREGNACVPTALGLGLGKSDLFPFEEPAHVTHFHEPALSGPPPSQSKLEHSSDSTARLLDTLAIPTDISTARRGSLASIESLESLQTTSEASLCLPTYSKKVPDEEKAPSFSSDSATLDNVIELLMMGGRDIAEAVMLLVPEASHKDDPAWKKSFNTYNSCIMEPWDGPALIAFTDGLQLGAQLDRNGLRPGRFIVTKDKKLILASEVGVVDIHPSSIIQKGRLTPGKMLLVDFREGKILRSDEIKQTYAKKYPTEEWLSRYSLRLSDLCLVMTDDELRRDLDLAPDDLATSGTIVASVPMNDYTGCRRFSDNVLTDEADTQYAPGALDDCDITANLMMFGYTWEKIELLLGPMAKYASEPLGSMGNDSPLACLSNLPRVPTDYFQQMFAQGTNPSIDPIREGDVMSLVCPIGKHSDFFSISHNHAKKIMLEEPVLTPPQFKALATLPGYPTHTIDLSWPKSAGSLELVTRLLRIQTEAEKAVRNGSRILILSDRRAGKDRFPIWSSLAVGAVQRHLLQKRLRLNCSIAVETGEAADVHQIAFLLSSGADAVFPYMAYQALSKIRFNPDEAPLPLSRLLENYCSAVRLGLLRVMSKIGVCTMLSYKGGCFFQPLGVNQSVLRLCFDDSTATIGGVGFDVITADLVRLHLQGFPPRPLPGLVEGIVPRQLNDVGEYRLVTAGDAEMHANHPDTIAALQQAVQLNDFQTYRKFSDIQNALVDEVEIRGQLDFFFGAKKAIPLEHVEPAQEIVKRLVTGALSLGAISDEAHGTIALAMNAMGSRSNTGEGGETEELLGLTNSSVQNKTKQIASGRFGVTSAYLCNAEELQIKCGQGAKPGEGGELPGIKVTAKIAAARRSTPGVGLISPPPHHDMYSIEDVAQLIMDLKHGNPKARISAKLVVKLGVGVIAAGCVKAKIDHIVISGSSGASGARKLTAMKHSGLPWEIGLAETHQTLCLNGLREKVSLQVDGQLKTGRDVVYAALLGAEEFGFATQPLIALGCQMTRKCHLNACPTGIATQDPELRKRFRGKPEHLVSYFFMVAEEVRMYMARLGFRRFNEMIGRSDLLRPKSRLREHWKRSALDFRQLLVPGWLLSSPLKNREANGDPPTPRRMHCRQAHDHELDKVLDREIIRRARRSLDYQLPTVSQFPIRNVDRTVGGLLSYEVSRRYGQRGLPANLITISFRGSAGQSFGCWLAPGITFRLSGDCNDFTGKGLSGGIIAVKPPSESPFFNKSNENILLGNSALYGATSGRAFFAGVAGERFAVRNSGAITVVEGCGDYGGVVVVLGRVGKSFGAGMSGGIAYVLDLDPRRVNLHLVDLQSLGKGVNSDLEGDTLEFPKNKPLDDTKAGFRDVKALENLLKEHVALTKSYVAENILNNWSDYIPRFTKVFPKDMKRVLKQAIQEYVTTGSADAAALLDDWETIMTHKHEGFHLQTLPFTLRQFAEKYESRRQQLKRLRMLDVADSALSVLGNLATPSALFQFATELDRSGRLGDLLSEGSTEELTQLMKMTRFAYVQWRTGYSRGLKKEDTDLLNRLLPKTLTLSRRAVLKRFLLGEKQELLHHLEALEDSPLAASLLKASSASAQSENGSPSSRDSIRDKNWQTSFEETPSPRRGADTSSLYSDDLESLTPASGSTPIKLPRLSHFRRRQDVNYQLTGVDDVASSKPYLVRHPDATLGFHFYAKQKRAIKAAATRVLDWEEISLPINTASRLYDSLLETQASRCMGCGTPTCHYPNADGHGCPLGNRIPTWNALVVEGQWRLALERLLDTNNFPEFTGRVCPGPCEEACVLASRDGSVAIKFIELAVVEKGFQEGWIKPQPPRIRTQFRIAVVGSGPAGLAAAQQLNRAGHNVVVYERSDRAGGLLMYGIPNMKIDKKRIVQRRLDLLEAEGISFEVSKDIGRDIALEQLTSTYDAVLMAIGSRKQKIVSIPGSDAKGIVQGMDFLIKCQKGLLDSDSMDNCPVDRRVIVIGAGYIATDCIATAIRMGCEEIIQIINQEDTSAGSIRTSTATPVYKAEYAHEEAIIMQGKEPRVYGVRPTEFVVGPSGSVVGVKAVRVHQTLPISLNRMPSSNTIQAIKMTGNSVVNNFKALSTMHHLPRSNDLEGTERFYPADLVLLALGSEGAELNACRLSQKIKLDSHGNICSSPKTYRTTMSNVFACGDCRTGSSLVVSAIAEGRNAACAIDDFLNEKSTTDANQSTILWSSTHFSGQCSRETSQYRLSSLPLTRPSATNPLRSLNEVNDESFKHGIECWNGH